LLSAALLLSFVLAQISTDKESLLEPFEQSKSLFMKDPWKTFIAAGDFEELHILTAGGGGDVLGGIFLGRTLKRILKRMGKEHIKLLVFTTNLKRGEENPLGGPTSLENLGTVRNDGIFRKLSPVKKADCLYSLDRPGIVSRVVLNSRNLLVDIKEGTIVEQMKEWDISLMLMDVSVGSRQLAAGYESFVRGKKVLTVGLDMGGDILAKYPYPITEDNKNTHPEREVKSPVTDTVALGMFTRLQSGYSRKVLLVMTRKTWDSSLWSSSQVSRRLFLKYIFPSWL